MSEPGDLFDSFLRVLCDPEGGAELHRLHAPDAPIRQAAGIGPAAHTDAADFARTHRELAHRGADRLPQFADPVQLETHEDSCAGQSVTWFSLAERSGSRSLLAALGTQRIGQETRIGWCTLAARVEPWSYRQGLLQSLADYPWMRVREPAAARALVDASYFRQHWRPPLNFLTLPEARFSCQLSTACCRHDYEITLPPEAQLLVDAMPWNQTMPQLAGTRLPVRADGRLQLKSAQEACRFLGPAGLCCIHQVLGRQPFAACCVFPYSFAHTPEGIAVGLSPICGSTRLGLGAPIQERTEDLRERLVHAEPRSTEAYRLAPGVAISWENFQSIEKALCDCIAAGDLTMRRRLYVAAKLLWALRNNQPVQSGRWIAEPLAPVLPDLRAAIRGMLGRVLGWERAVLQALPRELPQDLHLREVSDAEIVTRILQNTLFCKVYSYPFDLTTAHNFLIVLYLITLTMQAAQAAPLSDAMWRELGSLGVHGLLRSLLHEGMPENFRTLFGTPEFGMWLLAV